MLKGADVPDGRKKCPGLDDCGMLQDGPDPCKGCKLRVRQDPGSGLTAAYYAALLTTYIKAFRPSPQELSWLDFEIYQVYLTASTELEHEEAKKYWQKRKKITKII